MRDSVKNLLLTICFEPIGTNSVFAPLRLSLLAISHFLRFSKSEFTAASRSVTETLEAVRFVSSANNRGFLKKKQEVVFHKTGGCLPLSPVKSQGNQNNPLPV